MPRAEHRPSLLSLSVLLPLLTACGGDSHGTAASADDPPVFARMELAAARAAAARGDRVLVVDATAKWCEPCRRMKATTWRDARVVAWFAAHGLAIALDVDERRAEAETLRIEGMPTMVAFRRDAEVDRLVGFRTADQLLEWLEGVAQDRDRIAALRERAAAVTAGTAQLSVSDRLDLARELVDVRQFDAALPLFERLWATMAEEEPAMVGVRGSFFVADLERLAAAHAPARQRFAQLRDELETALAAAAADPAAAGNLDRRRDWVLLNRVTADEDRTIAWCAAAVTTEAQRPALGVVSRHLERLLRARDRWVELGRLIRNPERRIAEEQQVQALLRSHAGAGADSLGEAERQRERLRDCFGMVYGAMVAVGRADDAAAIRERAAEVDAGPEMIVALDACAERARQAAAAAPPAGDGRK